MWKDNKVPDIGGLVDGQGRSTKTVNKTGQTGSGVTGGREGQQEKRIGSAKVSVPTWNTQK